MPEEDNDSLRAGRYENLLSLFEQTESLFNDAGSDFFSSSYRDLSSVVERYSRFELIGKGGLKDIFKAYDNRSKRDVAYALLQEKEGEKQYDQFIHEAWLTARLNHPNIIKIYDVGIRDDGRPYFTMDLKGNINLTDIILKNQQADLLEIFSKICDGVSYAHSVNILHLDLKPDNIQCDKHGEVVICDWGMGKSDQEILTDDAHKDLFMAKRVTLHGVVKGTPGYMAPEQMQAGEKKDHRTDIYALGCILHEIITGERVFKGSVKSLLEKTSARLSIPPPRNTYGKKISKSMNAILLKALAIDPEDRYQSAQELKQDLQRSLSGQVTTAERASYLRQLYKFCKRHRKPLSLGTVGAATFGCLIFILLQVKKDSQRNETVMQEFAEELDQINDSVSSDHLSYYRAKKLLNTDITTSGNPVETWEEARNILRKTGVDEKKNRNIDALLFELYCTQLNFRKAREVGCTLSSSYYRSLVEMVEHFPALEYNERERPPISKLVEVIEYLNKRGKTSNAKKKFINQVIKYDHFTRSKEESYGDVLAALLRLYNPGSTILVKEEEVGETLYIKATSDPQFIGIDDILYFSLASFEKVKIDYKTGTLRFNQLHKLQTKTLDLTEVKAVKVYRSIEINGLENLLLSPPLEALNLREHIINEQLLSE